MSLETVAEGADISVSYLSRIENRQREPTLDIVSKLANVLAVPMPVLIFLASDASELRGLDGVVAKIDGAGGRTPAILNS